MMKHEKAEGKVERSKEYGKAVGKCKQCGKPMKMAKGGVVSKPTCMACGGMVKKGK